MFCTEIDARFQTDEFLERLHEGVLMHILHQVREIILSVAALSILNSFLFVLWLVGRTFMLWLCCFVSIQDKSKLECQARLETKNRFLFLSTYARSNNKKGLAIHMSDITDILTTRQQLKRIENSAGCEDATR